MTGSDCRLAGRSRTAGVSGFPSPGSVSRDFIPTEKAALPLNSALAAEPKSKYRCRCDGLEAMRTPLSAPEHLCVMAADDEAPARQRLVDLLQKDSQVAAIIE